MIKATDILTAYSNIKEEISLTPLVYSSKLSEISGAKVYLKMEHLQITGSFKIRGVINKIKSIQQSDFEKPFIAASTGNHAAAFAYASNKFGFKGILFLPKNISKVKLNALAQFDVVKNLCGDNSKETEFIATEYARSTDGVLIHPYNDKEIINGQGTIGIEIQNQLPEVDTILCPVGGGGLVSGLLSYFKNSSINIIGCQPTNAFEMKDSIHKGKIVKPSTAHTIADATAGGIEDNALTFEICKKENLQIELISEDKIKEAIAFIHKFHETIIEPGAALSVATLLNSNDYSGKNVVLVLTGKKIDNNLFTKIIEDYDNCNQPK